MKYGICPNCNSELVKKKGRTGPFLSCSNFPKCRFSMDYNPEIIIFDWSNVERCPNCGGQLIKRKGKYGDFLSCSNFPKCRFSLDYKPQIKIKVLSEDKCPICGSKLIKRDGKNGSFVGCSDFPSCMYSRDLTSKERNTDSGIHVWESEQVSFQDEKYRSKVKLAKEFVSSNLEIDVEKLLELNEWDEDVSLCMNILNDHVTSEDKEYVELVLGHAHHRRDKRNSLEYACDLIVGWTIEDCIVEILNKMGYSTSLNGADKDRKLLLNPTSDSDLKILINGKKVVIEQVNDFTGYWKRTKHVPLRDKKYVHLKNENSLLFGIDFKNNLFFIIDVSRTQSNYIPYHKPFSKPAYAIKVTDEDFYKLNQVEDVFSRLLSKY